MIKLIPAALLALGLAGCATGRQAAMHPDLQLPQSPVTIASNPIDPIIPTNPSRIDHTDEALVNSSAPVKQTDSSDSHDSYSIGAIKRTRKTGRLRHASLTEVSGMSASLKTPGVLFAINDSGNSASVYALSEEGADLGEWSIKAKNRDWEDMSSMWLDGRAYLIIGDTGDNLKLHRHSTLYLVEEPTPGLNNQSALSPAMTLRFTFEDGPRNVEGFAVADNSIFLISKEPVTPAGPSRSNLYELTIPAQIGKAQPGKDLLIAKKVDSLPLPSANFESKLAAAMAGVDLNHITSLDIDVASNTAYMLTYRHVIRIQKQADQSWGVALATGGKRIFSHDLEQAEALAVSTNRAVWITSEKRAAPLWAIPISPPL